MSWKKRFYKALAQYLRDYHPGLDVVEVVEAVEETRQGGYCESCAYTEVVIDLWYLNSQGKRMAYTISRSFAELMEELE